MKVLDIHPLGVLMRSEGFNKFEKSLSSVALYL